MEQMGIVNIKGIDKAEILKCLVNDACISMGWFLPYANRYLNLSECEEMLKVNETKYFDFYNGKSLHINLNGHQLYTTQYDEANGNDACYNSIKHLLTKNQSKNEEITN
jgi:hypothetical protein|tara:strand:+ start:10058 stop:10384 length:327 start_codon:yes stop_codon:yes gene_type:complete